MRIVFVGTGAIGVPTLRMLRNTNEHELVAVITQPDKPVGRNQQMTPPPIKAAIADDQLSVLQPQRIKSDEAIAQIRALNPEVIVVIAYGQILPRSLLELPKTACVNLHASLLPRWRGAAPVQAAIAAGDHETGITVMYMNEGIDSGDILLQRRLALGGDETGGSLHYSLANIAPAALSDALASLNEGTAPRAAQNSELATYAPKLERKDGRIDWNESAETIERKIRAFDPWPGAFTDLPNKRTGREQVLKIFRASLLRDVQGRPGQIISTGKGELIIVAADGALVLLDVQLEGALRMPGETLLRGHPWIAKSV